MDDSYSNTRSYNLWTSFTWQEPPVPLGSWDASGRIRITSSNIQIFLQRSFWGLYKQGWTENITFNTIKFTDLKPFFNLFHVSGGLKYFSRRPTRSWQRTDKPEHKILRPVQTDFSKSWNRFLPETNPIRSGKTIYSTAWARWKPSSRCSPTYRGFIYTFY